ncbi:MAG: OmpA family protein [Geminicoccaceae bacterium]
MRHLLLGVSLLTLAMPAAWAQTTGHQTPGMGAAAMAPVSGQVAPGNYRIFFGFDEARLTPEAQAIVAEAARSYQGGGMARITVAGHTDTVGTAAFNQSLSEQRAGAVAAELVRLGVPAGSISTVGYGQTDLLVPTGDQVREPRNRRVEIMLPEAPPPVAPMPAPVAEAAPPPPPPEKQPNRFGVGVGAVYGHNFGEKDRKNGDKTQNDLAGVELTFTAVPGLLGGMSIKQSVLWSMNGVDDGLTGRSVLSLDLIPLDLWVVQPFLSANFGGVYGKGAQDGLVAGPELGFNINLPYNTRLRAKAAYDYQFRNAGWDEGILWGGLDLGIRF